MSADADSPTLADHAFALLQRGLPTHAISTGMLALAQMRHPVLSQFVIDTFARAYHVDMTQAQAEDLAHYDSFASFFTRALKPGARPLPEDPNALVSPVDGTISQCGPVTKSTLIQAKGKRFRVDELLGDAAIAPAFDGGSFATIYLSPRDYHRVHMPMAGSLRQWCYVPGRLFSVNPATVRALPGVFVRNERMAAIFDTAQGPLAMVLVGAMCVGGMETVWTGAIPRGDSRVGSSDVQLPPQPVVLERGAEMGRFNLGSTVILILPRGAAQWRAECIAGASLRMGEAIADLNVMPRKRARSPT